MTQPSELPLLTSKEVFDRFRDERHDAAMLRYYGQPSEDDIFERETLGALGLLDRSKSLWECVADLENQANSGLIMLRSYSILPIEDSEWASVESYIGYYYEKAMRHLRFLARVEAVSGRSLGVMLVCDYAQDMYPKLVRSIKSDPRLPNLLDKHRTATQV